jgi:hypothetical protein
MATAPNQSGPLPYIDPADMPDLYAIKGVGRCMEPLLADGALLVGDKRQLPEAGDTVIVHFRREIAPRYGIPGWIKRLAGPIPPTGFEGLIALEQLNPPKQYLVPSTHIAAIHKCVGTAESAGDGRALYKPNKEARHV